MFQTSNQVLRVNVAMSRLGISRSTLYRLVNAGELELIKVGRRASGVTSDSLAAYLDRQRGAAAKLR
jgi:excisionase family DNA binding protein